MEAVFSRLMDTTAGVIIVGIILTIIIASCSFVVLPRLLDILKNRKIKAGPIEIGDSTNPTPPSKEPEKQASLPPVMEQTIIANTINGTSELLDFENMFVKQMIEIERNFYREIEFSYNKSIMDAVMKIHLLSDDKIDENIKNDTTLTEDLLALVDLIIEKEVRKSFIPVMDDIKLQLEKGIIDTNNYPNFRDRIINSMLTRTKEYPKISRDIISNIIKTEIKDTILKILVDFIEEYKDFSEDKKKKVDEAQTTRMKQLDIIIDKLRSRISSK